MQVAFYLRDILLGYQYIWPVLATEPMARYVRTVTMLAHCTKYTFRLDCTSQLLGGHFCWDSVSENIYKVK